MRKMYITIIGIALIVSLTGAMLFVTAKMDTNDGRNGNRQNLINDLQFVKDDSGKRLLSIEYDGSFSNLMVCSVKKLGKDEKVYLGEQLVYDEELGTYRIEVRFGDTAASTKLVKKYPLGKVERLDGKKDFDAELKVRINYPPDDSDFIIYIGSDKPINIDEFDSRQLDNVKGTLNIPFE